MLRQCPARRPGAGTETWTRSASGAETPVNYVLRQLQPAVRGLLASCFVR